MGHAGGSMVAMKDGMSHITPHPVQVAGSLKSTRDIHPPNASKDQMKHA